MNIGNIVLKNLRQHALSTSITALSIALAGGLMMSVWAVKDQSRATFTQMTGGFDAVAGPRSSELQLVLNSIFHLETSPGTVEWSDFLELKKEPRIAAAVPISVGDNYRGYRLVGTIPEMFEIEYAPGKKHALEPDGDWFDPLRREAVIGSFVAQRLGLKVGDEFHPYHGLNFNEKEEHAETYVVIGVLKPSNTPADRVMFIPMEGLQKMSGHTAETATDVSAVLLKFNNPIAGKALQLKYNREGSRLTVAWPIGTVMAQLLDKISWFDKVLAAVAGLVAVVAAGSVLASIYNSMNERRREIAVFRALGARRRTVFAAIVLEAGAIGLIGMAAAFGVYFVIVTVVSQMVRAQTGVVLDPSAWNPILVIAPGVMILLSALAGLVPAGKAYQIDVAENLAPVA